MLDVWTNTLKKGVGLAEKCNCRDGCPRCIHPPRYRASDVGRLSKKDGLAYARRLLEIVSTPHEEEFDGEVHGWRLRQ